MAPLRIIGYRAAVDAASKPELKIKASKAHARQMAAHGVCYLSGMATMVGPGQWAFGKLGMLNDSPAWEYTIFGLPIFLASALLGAAFAQRERSVMKALDNMDDAEAVRTGIARAWQRMY